MLNSATVFSSTRAGHRALAAPCAGVFCRWRAGGAREGAWGWRRRAQPSYALFDPCRAWGVGRWRRYAESERGARLEHEDCQNNTEILDEEQDFHSFEDNIYEVY